MRSLIFAKPAAQDLSQIADYIALDNPIAAEKVFREVIQTTEALAHFPNLGRRGRVTGTREIILSNAPYVVVYRSNPDRIIIIAIFHTARDLRQVLRARVSGLKGSGDSSA